MNESKSLPDPTSPEVAAAEPAARLSQLQRYELLIPGCGFTPSMEPCEAGEFVKMRDVAAALRVDPKAETPEKHVTLLWTDADALRMLLARAINLPEPGVSVDDLSAADGMWKRLDAACEAAAERQGVAPPPDKSEDRALSVTRLEVIDEEGRALTRRPCEVELSWQDDDRTLKVFIKGGRPARQEIPPAATSADLPTDVDTLRRLRARVDAALDEKYTHKVVEEVSHEVSKVQSSDEPRDRSIRGNTLLLSEVPSVARETQPDRLNVARGAAERSPAPQGTKNDDDDHARVDVFPSDRPMGSTASSNQPE